MKISSEVQKKWLIRKNEKDDFKLVAKVISEEEKESNGSPYTVIQLSDAEGEYQVSSWALMTEKGVELNTEVGMYVQIYCKKGNNTKFFIKNIEEKVK